MCCSHRWESVHDRWWGRFGDPGNASAESMTFEFRHGPAPPALLKFLRSLGSGSARPVSASSAYLSNQHRPRDRFSRERRRFEQIHAPRVRLLSPNLAHRGSRVRLLVVVGSPKEERRTRSRSKVPRTWRAFGRKAYPKTAWLLEVRSPSRLRQLLPPSIAV